MPSVLASGSSLGTWGLGLWRESNCSYFYRSSVQLTFLGSLGKGMAEQIRMVNTYSWRNVHLGHEHRIITRQRCFASNINMLISAVLISVKQVKEVSPEGGTFLPSSCYHGNQSTRVVPTMCLSLHCASVSFSLEDHAVPCVRTCTMFHVGGISAEGTFHPKMN